MLYIFYGTLILSTILFIVIWGVHLISLLRHRKQVLDFGRLVIWTIVPVVMLASLTIFGWQIVDTIQQAPIIQVDITGHM